MNETLTVEKDRVLAAAEKCDTFKGIAKELWPDLFAIPHRFKIGDRVTHRRSDDPSDGLSGTVRGYTTDNTGVEFDRPFERGHDLGGLCKDGHGRWCAEDKLSPEEQWEDVTHQLRIYTGYREIYLGYKGTPHFMFKAVAIPDPTNNFEGKIEDGHALARRKA